MRRMLILTAIFFGSAIVGLLVASWLVSDMRVGIGGFVVAVVAFTLAQSLLTPLITRLAAKFSPPLVGGVGLISTGLALWLSSLFDGGIHFVTAAGWIAATLVVWLVTALGGWLLPLWLLKKKVASRSSR